MASREWVEKGKQEHWKKIVDHTVFENINQTPCVQQNINSQTSFEIFFNLNVQSLRLDIW